MSLDYNRSSMALPLSSRTFTVIFAGIFFLAVVLRFAGLASLPLNEYEATHALSALGDAQAAVQPAYELLTAPLFQVFGASEAAARFWPALFGLGLVALPLLWRERLGDKATLLLSFVLAVDPGLVALSHLASGRMLALAGAMFALAAWRAGRPLFGGAFAALALLAAPTVLLGLLAALAAWFVLRPPVPNERAQLSAAGSGFAATILVSAGLLVVAGQGVGGLASSLTGFFASAIPGVTISTVIFALIGYELPILIFGVIGAARAWAGREPPGRVLSLFAVAALLVILVHPGRQVADLVWVIVPFAVLAAIELSAYFNRPQIEAQAAYGATLVLLILFAFAIMALARAADDAVLITFVEGYSLPVVPPALLLAASVLLIAAFVAVLVGLGWSAMSAVQGTVWAACVVFALFMISSAARFTRHETTSANELWSPGPAAGSLTLMEDTLQDLSFWEQGQMEALPIDVRLQSAALAWTLRDLQPFEGEGEPVLAVTSGESQPETFATYRGQSFALNQTRAWSGWPPNFFAWLLFRRAPLQNEQIILWARPDLFIDQGLSQEP